MMRVWCRLLITAVYNYLAFNTLSAANKKSCCQ